MANEKQLIFVLGMHRSGTSAVTRLLNLLGAELGKELLAAQEAVNEKGFWEHKELVRINEDILTTLDSAWFDFSSYPSDWWTQPYFERFKKQIQSFVDSTFSFSELAALKDPRLCRLFPLWREALQFSGKKLKTVLVLRHPDEVVASMCRRDPFTRETAYLLWAVYVRDAELASRAMPRSIVQYQSILEDWRSIAGQIGSALEIEWHGLNDATVKRIDEEISPDLKHNTAQQRTAETGIERICLDAWKVLKSEEKPEMLLDATWKELDGLLEGCTQVSQVAYRTNQKLLDTTGDLSGQIGERDQMIQEKLKQLEYLGQNHQHALDVIQKKDEQLSTLGDNHQHALEVIQQRDEQLDLRNEQLELRNKQMERLLSNKLIRVLNKTLKLTDIE